MGFPRQEDWRGLLFPSPGDLPYPGTELRSPVWHVSVIWQMDSLPLSHLGSPILAMNSTIKKADFLAFQKRVCL